MAASKGANGAASNGISKDSKDSKVLYQFVETPKQTVPTFETNEECGVRTTSVCLLSFPPFTLLLAQCEAQSPQWHLSDPPLQYPTIKNAPLPADAAGSVNFSNIALFSILGGVPFYLAWKVGGGLKTTIFFALFTSAPLLSVFWVIASVISPRLNEKAKLPGRPVEHYLTFKKPEDKAKYHGKSKIPMETFQEMYFDGDVEFNGDALDILEYRHDWASFRFTYGLIKFFLTGMIPEVIMHTRSQGTSSTRSSLCPAYANV